MRTSIYRERLLAAFAESEARYQPPRTYGGVEQFAESLKTVDDRPLYYTTERQRDWVSEVCWYALAGGVIALVALAMKGLVR